MNSGAVWHPGDLRYQVHISCKINVSECRPREMILQDLAQNRHFKLYLALSLNHRSCSPWNGLPTVIEKSARVVGFQASDDGE